MSRAMNLNASEADVKKACAELAIAFTSIETLLPSGTRIVCLNGDGAAMLRRKMLGKVVEGTVKRMPIRLATAS
jgi:hypothetical protein